MSGRRNARSKAPQGKPSGSGRKGSGLREAHTANIPEIEDKIAETYTDESGRPASNVHTRHENRNTDKGREDQGKDTTSE